jgi:hypothetical protein
MPFDDSAYSHREGESLWERMLRIHGVKSVGPTPISLEPPHIYYGYRRQSPEPAQQPSSTGWLSRLFRRPSPDN